LPKVSRSALLDYSDAHMFNLVNDIAAYPKFLPWCSGARIIQQAEAEIVASIDISHSGLHKSFTTRNTLAPHKSIELQLLDGPFKSLQGLWRFQALDADSCKVLLDLEYEFSSKLLGLVVGPVFSQIANTLVDAFVDRASIVYGSK